MVVCHVGADDSSCIFGVGVLTGPDAGRVGGQGQTEGEAGAREGSWRAM